MLFLQCIASLTFFHCSLLPRRCGTMLPVNPYESSSRRLGVSAKESASRIGQRLRTWKESSAADKAMSGTSHGQPNLRKLGDADDDESPDSSDNFDSFDSSYDFDSSDDNDDSSDDNDDSGDDIPK